MLIQLLHMFVLQHKDLVRLKKKKKKRGQSGMLLGTVAPPRMLKFEFFPKKFAKIETQDVAVIFRERNRVF